MSKLDIDNYTEEVWPVTVRYVYNGGDEKEFRFKTKRDARKFASDLVMTEGFCVTIPKRPKLVWKSPMHALVYARETMRS